MNIFFIGTVTKNNKRKEISHVLNKIRWSLKRMKEMNNPQLYFKE